MNRPPTTKFDDTDSGWISETTEEIGRIVLAPDVPDGYGLLYTTIDFSGRLRGEDLDALTRLLRRKWGSAIGLATCTQVHGTEIVFATNPPTDWRETGECDALWTDRPHVALGIKVADCLPVTLIDPEHGVVANLHSGWRGAAAGITDRTIAEIQRLSSFSVETARAWLGPSIRGCCFEVGEEVVDAFAQRYGNVDDCIDRTRGERPYLDLVRLTRRVLAGSGIAEERIADSGLCTRCEPASFHSYRRDRAASGRVLAIAVQA